MTNPMVLLDYRNMYGGEIILEENTIIGAGCIVLPSVRIEEYASI